MNDTVDRLPVGWRRLNGLDGASLSVSPLLVFLVVRESRRRKYLLTVGPETLHTLAAEGVGEAAVEAQAKIDAYLRHLPAVLAGICGAEGGCDE